jgi:hypothetical protein
MSLKKRLVAILGSLQHFQTEVSDSRYGDCAAALTIDSACALEVTRRVTGYGVTIHARFAHINALTKLPCIIVLVSLGNAHTLLFCVFNPLRTRRKANRYCHQNAEAS